jgi:hypothetical protein
MIVNENGWGNKKPNEEKVKPQKDAPVKKEVTENAKQK